MPELQNKEQGAHVVPPLTLNTAQGVGLLKCLTCAVLCYLLLGSEKKEKKKWKTALWHVGTNDASLRGY